MNKFTISFLVSVIIITLIVFLYPKKNHRRHPTPQVVKPVNILKHLGVGMHVYVSDYSHLPDHKKFIHKTETHKMVEMHKDMSLLQKS